MASLRVRHGETEARCTERIAPVLNGMETDRFRVLRHNELEPPTAVMLSHVYELKGVKDAIKAAAIIVQEYGITDYQLLIYGSLDKDVAYVAECRQLIGSNNLGENVSLSAPWHSLVVPGKLLGSARAHLTLVERSHQHLTSLRARAASLTPRRAFLYLR